MLSWRGCPAPRRSPKLPKLPKTMIRWGPEVPARHPDPSGALQLKRSLASVTRRKRLFLFLLFSSFTREREYLCLLLGSLFCCLRSWLLPLFSQVASYIPSTGVALSTEAAKVLRGTRSSITALSPEPRILSLSPHPTHQRRRLQHHHLRHRRSSSVCRYIRQNSIATMANDEYDVRFRALQRE